MKLKRAVLAELGRDELKEIVEQLEMDGVDRRSAALICDSLGSSRPPAVRNPPPARRLPVGAPPRSQFSAVLAAPMAQYDLNPQI